MNENVAGGSTAGASNDGGLSMPRLVPTAARGWGQGSEYLPALRLHMARLSFWLVMTASFGLMAWLSDGGRIDAKTAYIMVAVNMLIVAVLEQVIPRVPGNNMFRDRQSLRDLGHLFFFKFVCRPFAWTITLAIVGFIASYKLGAERVWPTNWPVLIQFVLLLLLFDLIGYWYHRLLHSVDRLFAFHAIHHDTRQVHMLKAVRVHFAEQFVNFILVVTPFLLVGCPPSLLAWLGMWNVFESNLAHSNVDQRFPSWLHYVVRTIDVHYIHHANDHKMQNSNFGGLPIWDLVFGTYRHPLDNPVTATGIQGDPVPAGFLAQLAFPFRAQLRAAVPAPMAGSSERVLARGNAQEGPGPTDREAGALPPEGA